MFCFILKNWFDDWSSLQKDNLAFLIIIEMAKNIFKFKVWNKHNLFRGKFFKLFSCDMFWSCITETIKYSINQSFCICWIKFKFIQIDIFWKWRLFKLFIKIPHVSVSLGYSTHHFCWFNNYDRDVYFSFCVHIVVFLFV